LKEKKNVTSVYAIGDIARTKDTDEMFKETTGPNLDDGVNKVKCGKVKFDFIEEIKKWRYFIINPDEPGFNDTF